MNRRQYMGWALFLIASLSFLGGIIGGFLGIGVLDRILFPGSISRDVILQESSVIIDVVDKLEPSVVSISSEAAPTQDIFGREFEGRSGAGTGIIISKDGLILTNKHVVPVDSEISVTLSDGQLVEDAVVIDRDPFNDIAYLKIETDEELEPAELGDSDQVVTGQRVIAIGNVLGQFSNSVTSGIISAIGRPVLATDRTGTEVEQLQGLLQTDAAINPGNSGGPLVNIQGQVIGINTAVAGNAENIGFAIPINQVKAGIASIEEEGRLIRPYLGVRYINIDSAVARDEDLDVSDGALLIGSSSQPAILPGSPAEEAGLLEGDIIVAVDGQDIDRKSPLGVKLSRYRAGETIELAILRDGEELDIDVTLEEAPEDLF